LRCSQILNGYVEEIIQVAGYCFFRKYRCFHKVSLSSVQTPQRKVVRFQKLSKDNVDAAVRSYAEVHKGFEALRTDNAKKAFEDTTRTFEQLLGAKSFEGGTYAETHT
jgi:hypothetical protein